MGQFSIVQMPSGNWMEREGWIPDLIASHITEGSFVGAVSWLRNPESKASAHYVVSKTGLIDQLVDITKAAWINGTSEKPEKLNYYMNSLLPQVRERKTNANYYSVGIEHEGLSTQSHGRLTDVQLEATIWLHKHIISEIKRIWGTTIILDREHIVGHYQVDPIRKPNCPGQDFQWDELLSALKGSVKEDDEDMVRYVKLADIPNEYGFRDVITKLMDAKIINGDGSDAIGNNDVIDLSLDQVRTLVFEYRGGAFDRKLISLGKQPVIKI